MTTGSSGKSENLRPFQPGQSGNPSGRPKGEAEFRRRCRAFMDDEGWELLVAIAGRKGKEQLYALKFIAEIGYGKAKQTVDIGSERGLRIVIDKP